MLFYYVQHLYQKNHVGTRVDKRHPRSPGVDICGGKESVASIKEGGGSEGCCEPLSGSFSESPKKIASL